MVTSLENRDLDAYLTNPIRAFHKLMHPGDLQQCLAPFEARLQAKVNADFNRQI